MVRGWDEVQERAFFFDRFTGTPCELIFVDDRLAGLRRVEYHDDYICLDYLVLSPEHQRRGIGGRIVRDLLREARERGQPVTLKVLKVNPAKALYERLGFVEVGSDDRFYFMESAINR
jgi:ribosomal protein S18 acetylase RimI-like enzyme